MHKLLIPLLACLSATLVHAQVPKTITLSPKATHTQPNPTAPDAACSAGTFVVGQVNAQSNDTDLPTIFLCRGDSVLMDHNGDESFMDPDPTTMPGIAYAFYNCPPTTTGDDVAVLADPCLWPGAAGNGFFATNGPPSGDHWFFNTGGLFTATNFCNGTPCQIYFAPITITDYPGGKLEPGCVDVNTGAAFSVIYLRAITEKRPTDNTSTIDTNFGDDCKGRFRLYGGYPEWDLNATYTVSIYLDSDPSIKALIYTQPSQMKHSTDVIFSVPQPGTYRVVVEDGKSCGHTFLVNMSGCAPADNVTIDLPDLVAPPGSQICVPINVVNFDNIIGASWSISWDPTVMTYVSFQNASDSLSSFDPSNLNINNIAQGFLGLAYSDFSNPNGTTIPVNEPFIELCFQVIAPLGTCTPLDVSSFPSLVTMDNSLGTGLAITVDTGSVCIDLLPLEVTFEVCPPNCDGTASLAAIIASGTAPFDVSWRQIPGGAPTTVTSNIADTIKTIPVMEGVWEICVTDQNGFGITVCDTLTVDVPNLGSTLAVVQLPTCNGSTNGSLRVDVTVDGVVIPNPGPNFTYIWNTVPPQITQTISGVGAGNYAVTVTETVSGCTAVAAGSVSHPAPIALNLQITDASCDGIADGVIVASASGGTPGPAGSEYSFSWQYSPDCMQLFTDDSGVGLTSTLSQKPSGCYYVTVTDANGCTFVQSAIQLPNARDMIVDTLNILEPSCFGLADGCAEFQASAQPAFPNPNFQFFYNTVPAGNYQITNVGNTSMICGLPASTTQVTIVETNTGCSVEATVVLNQPEPVTLAITDTVNPSCQFQNDGSITVAASGGTGTFTYNWSGGLAPGPNKQNLTPGMYTVTATDINGCSVSMTIDLQLPPPPPITNVDSTSVVCGADGSITVTAPTAVSFAWTTLLGDPVGSSATITGLPGDTYVLTIVDAQNCVNMDTFTLTPVIPLFFADTSLILPTCNGDSDGTVAVDVQGGNPLYTYVWSNGPATSVNPGVAAGTYTVTVTDLQSCTLVGTFTLANPPGIVIQYNTIQPATCPDVCDGQATLVTYYNTVPPTFVNFNFMWADGSTDSVRTDLCAGFHVVTVTDPVKGCFRIDSSLSVDGPAPFNASFTTEPVTCFGGDDGEARVMVSGANGGPFTYLWSNNSTIATATGLMAGDQTVTITDATGCVDTFVVNITQPEEIVLTQDMVNSKPILCAGDSSGILAVTVTGGVPGFTYQWGDTTNIVGTANPIANLGSGAYSVTVTDANGCTGELPNIILNDPPAVVGNYLPWDPIICNGDETTLYIDDITGGSGAPYQYSLDFGVFLDPTFPINMGGGEHFITYIDRLGCENTVVINVLEPEPIIVSFDPPVIEIELGDSIQLFPIVTGAVVDTFEWTPISALSMPFDFEPFTKTYESETYTIVVYDENGCSATGTVEVNVDPNRNVYIPNAFIPFNSNGLNDHFNVYTGRGVEKVNYMQVYDRWGSLMYERRDFLPNNNDFSEGWDGRYKGDLVNPAVFVYIIEVKFLDGRVLIYRGDVTVLR